MDESILIAFLGTVCHKDGKHEYRDHGKKYYCNGFSFVFPEIEK